jgi:hypothetical protein
VFDLQIRLKLARNLFKLPNATQEEIDETLIVYGKNKRAFQLMIDCLEIKGDEDFTLNYKKFKGKLFDMGNITVSENLDITQPPTEIWRQQQQEKMIKRVIMIQARVRGFLARHEYLLKKRDIFK